MTQKLNIFPFITVVNGKCALFRAVYHTFKAFSIKNAMFYSFSLNLKH